MKKIKIFDHKNEMVLEEDVNRFLADHPASVSDIQYRMSDDGKYSLMHSVMIIYEDEETTDTQPDHICDWTHKARQNFERKIEEFMKQFEDGDIL